MTCLSPTLDFAKEDSWKWRDGLASQKEGPYGV